MGASSSSSSSSRSSSSLLFLPPSSIMSSSSRSEAEDLASMDMLRAMSCLIFKSWVMNALVAAMAASDTEALELSFNSLLL